MPVFLYRIDVCLPPCVTEFQIPFVNAVAETMVLSIQDMALKHHSDDMQVDLIDSSETCSTKSTIVHLFYIFLLSSTVISGNM